MHRIAPSVRVRGVRGRRTERNTVRVDENKQTSPRMWHGARRDVVSNTRRISIAGVEPSTNQTVWHINNRVFAIYDTDRVNNVRVTTRPRPRRERQARVPFSFPTPVDRRPSAWTREDIVRYVRPARLFCFLSGCRTFGSWGFFIGFPTVRSLTTNQCWSIMVLKVVAWTVSSSDQLEVEMLGLRT